MKIVGIETIPVSVPYRQAERSFRVQRGGVSDVIVKLVTDTGLVGWGESCSGADIASIEAAVRAMAPFVIGRDPWETEAIARDVFKIGLWDYRIGTGNFAYAGIDMALWDLCGKDCGQPLYRLFGGAMRSEVDYFYYLTVGTPEEIAEQCRDGVARGYSVFYLKVGVDCAAEEAMLVAARQALGADRKIRIDANEAWTVAEASRLLTRWNDLFGIDLAEAPVKAFPHSLMQTLRRMTPVALCANEGLGSEADVLRMIAAESTDVLCFSSYWVGSLRRFHTLAQLAHLQGIGVCKHTHGELGLAAAAAHHVMLALPNTVHGCQQTASIMGDDILTEPLPIAAGPRWGIPERPGLGVEVDEAKLRLFGEAYRRDGQFLPYSA
ncbi:MAG: mandelate racemase/muconate lactonizing enzyme family protein [Rhizobiaceae bacterium]|nr:mandelate racemase/muconate lactonizing enzyme family protein [Rhizobiaceae bacterium]